MADIRDHEEIQGELEEIARDLLLLTRTVAIYPETHPKVTQIAERLSGWAASFPEGEVTLGVASTDIIYKDQFYGGRETRLETLARRLHQHHIARITWRAGLTVKEVFAFARVLSGQELQGEELVEAVEKAGIVNLVLTPLDISALHEKMRLVDIDYSEASRERRNRIWQWVQRVSGNPVELVKCLGDEEFWRDGFSEDRQVQSDFAQMLAGLGSTLDSALHLVDDDKRAEIEAKLHKIGRTLRPEVLATLMAAHMAEGALDGPSATALMKHITGEKLALLLGGLVSLGGDREEKVAVLLEKYVPKGSIMGLAGLVREWKVEGEKVGLAAEVWEWLESYLLNMDENQFMGEGYRATLDRMAERLRTSGGRAAAFGFYEDPEFHLDAVCAGLVRLNAKGGEDIFSKRLSSRLTVLDPIGAINLIDFTDRMVPDLFDRRHDVFERLYGDLASNVRDLPPNTRNRLLAIAKRHEEEALPILLKQLATEERSHVRRFLIEVLSSLSKASVPRIIQSTRNAPWYYARNVATVFGQMGDPRTVPFLRALLEVNNQKLRREAMRSLSLINDSAARAALAAHAQKSGLGPDESRVARALSEKGGPE